jgi:hypothetical protein
MDSEQHSSAELQALRALCRETTPLEDRRQLIKALETHSFTDPERQVVFESLRMILSRGGVTPERLRVHLNNRGFPETDVEKYFQPDPLADRESEARPEHNDSGGMDR